MCHDQAGRSDEIGVSDPTVRASELSAGGCWGWRDCRWKVVGIVSLALAIVVEAGWGQGLFNPRSGKASVFGNPHGVALSACCVSSQVGRNDQSNTPEATTSSTLNFCNTSNLNATSHLELCPGATRLPDLRFPVFPPFITGLSALCPL